MNRRLAILIAFLALALATLACGMDPLGEGPMYDTQHKTLTCPAGQYLDALDNGWPWCRVAQK